MRSSAAGPVLAAGEGVAVDVALAACGCGRGRWGGRLRLDDADRCEIAQQQRVRVARLDEQGMRIDAPHRFDAACEAPRTRPTPSCCADTRFSDAITSSTVNAEPSCHTTPLRSLNSQVSALRVSTTRQAPAGGLRLSPARRGFRRHGRSRCGGSHRCVHAGRVSSAVWPVRSRSPVRALPFVHRAVPTWRNIEAETCCACGVVSVAHGGRFNVSQGPLHRCCESGAPARRASPDLQRRAQRHARSQPDRTRRWA